MTVAHTDSRSTQQQQSHDKNLMTIDQNLYQYWINSLVKTVKQCDKEYSPDLERSWQKILRTGVDHITAQYDAPAA